MLQCCVRDFGYIVITSTCQSFRNPSQNMTEAASITPMTTQAGLMKPATARLRLIPTSTQSYLQTMLLNCIHGALLGDVACIIVKGMLLLESHLKNKTRVHIITYLKCFLIVCYKHNFQFKYSEVASTIKHFKTSSLKTTVHSAHVDYGMVCALFTFKSKKCAREIQKPSTQ